MSNVSIESWHTAKKQTIKKSKLCITVLYEVTWDDNQAFKSSSDSKGDSPVNKWVFSKILWRHFQTDNEAAAVVSDINWSTEILFTLLLCPDCGLRPERHDSCNESSIFCTKHVWCDGFSRCFGILPAVVELSWASVTANANLQEDNKLVSYQLTWMLVQAKSRKWGGHQVETLLMVCGSMLATSVTRLV